MNKLFTKKYLLNALKEARLPHTYQTLLKYERMGVVPAPLQHADINGVKWRLYSEEEVAEIVEKVGEYKDSI